MSTPCHTGQHRQQQQRWGRPRYREQGLVSCCLELWFAVAGNRSHPRCAPDSRRSDWVVKGLTEACDGSQPASRADRLSSVGLAAPDEARPALAVLKDSTRRAIARALRMLRRECSKLSTLCACGELAHFLVLSRPDEGAGKGRVANLTFSVARNGKQMLGV